MPPSTHKLSAQSGLIRGREIFLPPKIVVYTQLVVAWIQKASVHIIFVLRNPTYVSCQPTSSLPNLQLQRVTSTVEMKHPISPMMSESLLPIMSPISASNRSQCHHRVVCEGTQCMTLYHLTLPRSMTCHSVAYQISMIWPVPILTILPMTASLQYTICTNLSRSQHSESLYPKNTFSFHHLDKDRL